MLSSRRTPSAAAALALAAAVIACSVCAAQAQTNPGPQFPFYDNCRRNATYSRWSLRLLQPPVNVDNTTVSACFIVRVNNSAVCPVETFSYKKERIVSRCCNTSFAKIKFYVDATCRKQFVASPLRVPTSVDLSKVVSPTWDGRPANYTEVKYTRFGPIPQDVLNGTTFCLTLKAGGPCNVSSLLGVTSPFNRQKKLFQVALYDRKKDNYECCPTFTFAL